jgi:hypothetical protein
MVLVIVALMTLLLDRDPHIPTADEQPELGVIEEARARQHRRRVRAAVLLVVGVLAGTGALLWGGANGGGSGSGSRPGRPARPPAPPIRAASNAAGARLAPALEGGSYGWNVFHGEGGSCCTTPVRGNPLGGGFTLEVRPSYELLTFLSGPELAGVMVNGHRVPVATLPGHLPFHLRLVQAKIPKRPRVNAPPPTVPAAPGLTPTLVPLDVHGRVIPTIAQANRRATIRWWERPGSAPRGPCQLRSRGINALTPEWGHVAGAILPSPDRIIGRAFFSCIDTEYYLHGWPLDAAILLDAAHPGTQPAAIPGLRAMASAPGYVNGPGDSHGDLTATRVGNAWLVVAGGSGSAQRLAVLRHLNATIRL